MTGYFLRSHAGTGLYLTVESTSTIITGRANVGLDNLLFGNSMQIWTLSGSGLTGVEVCSANNPPYMLNAYRSTWNCDVYLSNSDTILNFLSAGNGFYRIQLNSDTTRYLTATGTTVGSNVNWQALGSGGINAQLWQMITTTAPDLPSQVIIPMPSGRNCNWNQKCQAVTQYFGTNACTLVAGLDAANFYATNGVGYVPADMNSSYYWSSTQGYTWRIPGPGTILSAEGSLSQDGFLALIQSEIRSGHPCLITIGYSVANTHTVFAYGFTNNASAYADIYVFDPANSSNANSENGKVIDLYTSMDNNHDYFNILRVRPTR